MKNINAKIIELRAKYPLLNQILNGLEIFGRSVHKNWGNIAYWLFMYWFAEMVEKMATDYQNKVVTLVAELAVGIDSKILDIIIKLCILILEFIKKIAQSYLLSMQLFLPAMIVFFIFRIWLEDFKLKRKLKI
jgi:hypothetical protein